LQYIVIVASIILISRKRIGDADRLVGTVLYTTPEVRCRHRRYECDGGINEYGDNSKFPC